MILPVSGVLHKVKSGESLESIAALYGIPEDEIATFHNGALEVDETVIVPNGKPAGASGAGRDVLGSGGSRKSNLPETSGYFGRPGSGGWNWGVLHGENAVDISTSCSSPIYAAASGTVSAVGSPTSWNGGLGGLVRIEHPNGTETLYSHLSKLMVAAGEYVQRGQLIALIGTTGRSTGCHLHFEVHGARNPLAKY